MDIQKLREKCDKFDSAKDVLTYLKEKNIKVSYFFFKGACVGYTEERPHYTKRGEYRVNQYQKTDSVWRRACFGSIHTDYVHVEIFVDNLVYERHLNGCRRDRRRPIEPLLKGGEHFIHNGIEQCTVYKTSTPFLWCEIKSTKKSTKINGAFLIKKENLDQLRSRNYIKLFRSVKRPRVSKIEEKDNEVNSISSVKADFDNEQIKFNRRNNCNL